MKKARLSTKWIKNFSNAIFISIIPYAIKGWRLFSNKHYIIIWLHTRNIYITFISSGILSLKGIVGWFKWM